MIKETSAEPRSQGKDGDFKYREVHSGLYEAVKNSARVVMSSLTLSQSDNRNIVGVQLGGGKVVPPPAPAAATPVPPAEDASGGDAAAVGW